MGFSVSGSFAILAFAAFVAIGMLYPTVSIGVDQISRAQQSAGEDRLVRSNTDIAITQAEWDGILDNEITIEVENTGSTVLSINDTDVIVDNSYFERDNYATEYVITASDPQDTETTLWQPGETYHVEISENILSNKIDLPPGRVKVVSDPGVSDSSEVS